MKHKSSRNTTVFRQHLLKAFFDKIKTDQCKWLFVAEKPNIQVIFNLLKICRYGYQKIRLAKSKSTQQTVCKNIHKRFTEKRSNDKWSNNKGSKDKESKVRQRVKRQKVKMIKIFLIWIIGNLQPSYQFCIWILYVSHGYDWPCGRSARHPSLS